MPRARAARAIAAVIGNGVTLDEALERAGGQLAGRDRALLREIAFGVCRRYFELDALLAQLMERPLKSRDADVRALLLVGLYQLRHMRVPDHAAINETVAASRELGKPWARGLVNAVLRAYQARADGLDAALSPAQRAAHPAWLLRALERAWPEQLPDILAANNAAPPMTLRVNVARTDREAWLASARAAGIAARPCAFAADGVVLAEALDVTQLPGFGEGLVSVQDEGAQLAAGLLGGADGERILDACAAPGGKACHLLERHPGVTLLALDASAARLERVRQNLQRLQLHATLVCGDAADAGAWWDGRPFDRILVDAPCSGTGVIRRHPDIHILRSAAQVTEAAALQLAILRGLWPCLKPGGTLLYSTCSVLPEENEATVAAFLAATRDAQEEPLDSGCGLARSHGRQLLPTVSEHDGFFYARLRKLGTPSPPPERRQPA